MKNNRDIQYMQQFGGFMKKENNEEKNKISSTKLSKVSLIFLILEFAVSFISEQVDALNFLNEIPYLIISLVLAIISQCKDKDKLSLAIIIVDSVLILLSIIILIVASLSIAVSIGLAASGCIGYYG